MSLIDIVIPAAVVAGCLLIMVAMWWWRRRDRAPRWSIDEPLTATDVEVTVDPALLSAWHRRHGEAVAAWIGAHEGVLRRLGDAQLAVDLTDPDLFGETRQAADGFTEALGAHPSPVMRAELSALQVAGEATLHAVRRGDYATAERQHLTYVSYRDEWVARLRQFSLDDPDLVALRQQLSGDDAVASLPRSEGDNGSDDLRMSG